MVKVVGMGRRMVRGEEVTAHHRRMVKAEDMVHLHHKIHMLKTAALLEQQ
jgi:hypothetical protein